MLNPNRVTKENKRALVMRVTIGRKRNYYSLGHLVEENHWDDENMRLKRDYDPENYKEYNTGLKNLYAKAIKAVNDMNYENAPLTFGEFKRRVFEEQLNDSVFDLFEYEIDLLKRGGKPQNAAVYKTVRNSLMRYCKTRKKRSLKFSEITVDFLYNYEAFLRTTCTGNGISNYMRTLRALVNKAISYKIIKTDLYPFRNQQNKTGYQITKVESETVHRALTDDEMREIINHNPVGKPGQALAKDLFLFSFYTIGQNPADMAELKWADIFNGRMNYRRKKTGKPFSIKLLPPAMEIINKYKSLNHSEVYVFPIYNEQHHKTPKQKESRFKTKFKRLNSYLKDIGKEIGLEKNFPLTMYVARHSWATIMKRKGVSTSLISEGLGHASEKVTQIYLDKFENDTLDKMNEMLLG